MSHGEQRMAPAAPVIVRIAGHPAAVMERFASSLCTEIASLTALEGELAQARATMVDRLYAAIGSSPPELRRFLLAVKRDCYNARSLAPHREAPLWAQLDQRVGPLAERLLELEAQRERLLASFATSHRREAERQGRLLWEQLGDRGFLEGLALASPDVFGSSQRLGGKALPLSGRRGARLRLSLLRYLSRSTFKLSPFSTFTRLALGQVRDCGDEPLRLQGDRWTERSLLRLKRYLLDQYIELLQRYPAWRNDLQVTLNSSVTEVDDGRFLFLRPSHWRVDAQRSKLIYVEEALVRAKLRGQLVASLRRLFAQQRPTYGELLAFLAQDLADGSAAEEIEPELEKLLEIGFLNLLPPWPSDTGHLEKRMLDVFASRPPDPRLSPFLERFARLVALEEGYHQVDDPAHSLAAIEKLLEEIWEAAAALGSLDRTVGRADASAHSIYQDVFLLPAADSGPGRELLHLPEHRVRDALRSIDPLLRLTWLFDHRHEMLHTLAVWARQRWPQRGDVALLELFHQIQPLWQEYVKFLLSSRQAGGWRATWNPLGLPDLEKLHRWRTSAWESLEAWLRSREGDQPLSPADLSALLDPVPRMYTAPQVGGCLFLQPADAAGTLWVLNRVKEGTGRFGSRYTPVMSRSIRQLYTSQLTACGVLDLDGERVELLDILSIRGDTLNVHSPQTPKILVLPGMAATELQSSQCLGLADLRVSFHTADQRPHLRDRTGQRYLTAHLGVANEDFMPTLVKFLCLFGPSELNAVFPPQRHRTEGEVTIGERTVLGTVVIQRRSWSFPKHQILDRIAAQSEAEAFVTINRWRRELDIPDKVFLIERVPHRLRGERFQPQFLDLTSPLFVSLLRSALQTEDSLMLVEMLPTPESFPCDGAGRRWAVEVLLDSLVFASGESPRQRESWGSTAGNEVRTPRSGIIHPEPAIY